jgi:hypothetical protein
VVLEKIQERADVEPRVLPALQVLQDLHGTRPYLQPARVQHLERRTNRPDLGLGRQILAGPSLEKGADESVPVEKEHIREAVDVNVPGGVQQHKKEFQARMLCCVAWLGWAGLGWAGLGARVR